MRESFPLNNQYLNKRIQEMQLKHWWIADQLGVAKLTLNRWVHGKVKNIQNENLEALAKILDCKKNSLIEQADDFRSFSSSHRQEALRYLLSQDFYRLMHRSGKLLHYDELVLHQLIPLTDERELSAGFYRLTLSAMAQNNIKKIAKWSKLALDYAQKARQTEIFKSAQIYHSYYLIRMGKLSIAHSLLNELSMTLSSNNLAIGGEICSMQALIKRDQEIHDQSSAFSLRACEIFANSQDDHLNIYLLRHAQNLYYAQDYEKAYCFAQKSLDAHQKQLGIKAPLPLSLIGTLLESAIGMEDRLLVDAHTDELQQAFSAAPPYQLGIYYRALAKSHLHHKAYHEALENLQLSVSYYHGMSNYQIELYRLLTTTAIHLKDSKKASRFAKLEKELINSLL